MDLYIYSDESGVFDKIHNQYFVFGGIILLSKNDKDICTRKYTHVGRTIRSSFSIPFPTELKATKINNAAKNKLYRSLNQYCKFGVVIKQDELLDRIFKSKKDKQRYLDYAYKIAIKRQFENLIKLNLINPEEVKHLNFFVDEHTTATNGYYELKEGLEQEFKNGTYRYDYNIYYPPIFPNLRQVQLKFCDSSSNVLVRAADIIANHIYYLAVTGQDPYNQPNNLFVTSLPYENKTR